MSQPEYRIQGLQLSKAFGDTQAVEDVSLQVAPAEIFGLVGPDGAGKTTTIRLLCGAMLPDAGEVHIAGIPLARQPDQAREQIGYLSQRFSLYEDLTVLENLRFFAELRGLSTDQWRPRSLEMLEFVGLADFLDRRAGNLSGGMKQKLGLASALVHRPNVLLLDEPTGGVDPVTRQDFWQLIIRIVSEEGVSVLVSTPYMDEAVRCHRIGFMRAGHMLLQGPPAEIRQRLADRILELRGPELSTLRAPVREVEGVEDVQTFGDRLHVRVAAGQLEAAQTRLTKMLVSKERADLALRPVAPQLEDVFIALLENQEQHD